MRQNVKKFHIEQKWLHEQYSIKGRSVRELADEVGCSIHNIKKWLKVWGLKRECEIHYTSWNKGLSKETNEKLRRLSESRRGEGNPMFGRDAWNKGLTAETNETMAKIVECMKNRIVSEETREKLRQAKLGKCGEESCHWKGGPEHLGKNGYKTNYKGYIHRQTVEKIIGRELLRGEHVHHLDGNRTNNTPENLIVLSPSSHSKLHHWMKDRIHEAPFQKLWLLAHNRGYLTLEKRDEDQNA